MTDPNRSVADELEEAEMLEQRSNEDGWYINAEYWRERASALRSVFALLAYAGRKP